MKKLLSVLFLGIAILTYTVAPVFAENYRYKLYDPKTNKSEPAEIITLSSRGNCYVLGFKSPNIACMIDSVENKENGMVGGKGVGFSIGDHNARIFYWKEYQPNTFNMELKSIIKEREEQGLYLDNNHYSIL